MDVRYYNLDETNPAISKYILRIYGGNSSDSVPQFRSSTMTNEEASKALVEGFKVIETDGDIFDAPKDSVLIRE
jgi:hypothetical protein